MNEDIFLWFVVIKIQSRCFSMNKQLNPIHITDIRSVKLHHWQYFTVNSRKVYFYYSVMYSKSRKFSYYCVKWPMIGILHQVEKKL